jgi:hypothetical protein
VLQQVIVFGMPKRLTSLSPHQALSDLSHLIQETRPVDLRLSTRLGEIYTWVEQYKPGKLTSAKYVMILLTQLIVDTENWLNLEEARIYALQNDDQIFYQELLNGYNPAEQHWLRVCFPAWFSEQDPKFQKWKTALISKRFTADDTGVLDSLSRIIEIMGGYVFLSLLGDLSLSTDLIAASSSGNALCIQQTRQGGTWLQKKHTTWQADLEHWKIDRGLLLSFVPPNGPTAQQSWRVIAGKVLYWCDNTEPGKYIVDTV